MAAVHAVRAVVVTDRAARYLAQLCTHTGHMSSGFQHGRSRPDQPDQPDQPDHAAPSVEDVTDTTGQLRMGGATCDLTADATALTLVVTAADTDRLQPLQNAVTRTLERIGRRDGLAVTWEAVTWEDPPDGTGRGASPPADRERRHAE